MAMGSITETLKETVDYLNAQGRKVGMMTVHLYRPFSAKYFFKAMPKSVKRIAVLDRTKEPGANGEPLYLDVRDLYYEEKDAPMIIGGRYGLSSKDTTPAMLISVYDNLAAKEPKKGFTVGITDDVTNLSLPLLEEVETGPRDAGHLVVEESGGGCPMGHGIVRCVEQIFELLNDALESVNALLIGHVNVLDS